MKRIKTFQVNAFARGPFTGNPAAVCPLDEWLPDSVLQSVAAENNLSETAFFVPREDGSYDLRWFTPTIEVDLCGHATLASGHVVLNVLDQGRSQATFHTRSGQLNVTKSGELLSLDLPSKRPVRIDQPELTATVERLLGTRSAELLDAGLPVAVFDDETLVAELQPDFRAMRSRGVRWMSVTAPAQDSETDFVSRYFAPGSGIDEDPVTGSAHGWLVPYWAERLGRLSLSARQVSRRGGWLQCEDMGERVSVAGEVVEYLAGEIMVQAP